MQTRIVTAILVIIFVVAGVAFLVRGARGVGEEGGAMPPGRKAPFLIAFSERQFAFSPVNTEGAEANDWQEASATLTFTDPRDKSRAPWTCDVVVGMSRRAEKWGDISKEYAAYAASTSASDAASTVVMTKAEWDPSEFCEQWRVEMQTVLGGIEGLRAKISYRR